MPASVYPQIPLTLGCPGLGRAMRPSQSPARGALLWPTADAPASLLLSLQGPGHRLSLLRGPGDQCHAAEQQSHRGPRHRVADAGELRKEAWVESSFGEPHGGAPHRERWRAPGRTPAHAFSLGLKLYHEGPNRLDLQSLCVLLNASTQGKQDHYGKG